MRRLQQFVVGTCLVLGTLLLVARVGAESLPSQTLDVTLLKSDAVVFATIESLSQPKDDKDAVDIHLRQVRTATTRWPEALTTFRVRGRLIVDTEAGKDFVVVRNELLTVGNRYLFLLRGGLWTDAPLLSSAPAIYLVSDGIVRCGSGNVYGLGTMGFICDLPSRTSVPPVTEDQFFEALVRSTETARRRRRDVEAEESEAARTLEPRSALSWAEGK